DLYLVGDQVVPSGHILYCPPIDLDRPLTWARAILRSRRGNVVIAQQPGRARAVVRLPARAAPGARPAPLWRRKLFDKNLGIVITANAALVLGLDAGPDGKARHALAALRLEDGRPIWRHPLPAPAVPWGVAVTRDGRVVVSLRSGAVLCLAGTAPDKLRLVPV
ncbi:MAG: hypothetical protein ACYS5V_12120, partial [Planctomycetota bacterium]